MKFPSTLDSNDRVLTARSRIEMGKGKMADRAIVLKDALGNLLESSGDRLVDMKAYAYQNRMRIAPIIVAGSLLVPGVPVLSNSLNKQPSVATDTRNKVSNAFADLGIPVEAIAALDFANAMAGEDGDQEYYYNLAMSGDLPEDMLGKYQQIVLAYAERANPEPKGDPAKQPEMPAMKEPEKMLLTKKENQGDKA